MPILLWVIYPCAMWRHARRWWPGRQHRLRVMKNRNPSPTLPKTA